MFFWKCLFIFANLKCVVVVAAAAVTVVVDQNECEPLFSEHHVGFKIHSFSGKEE